MYFELCVCTVYSSTLCNNFYYYYYYLYPGTGTTCTTYAFVDCITVNLLITVNK
jgi:hypothetical protein